MAIDRKARFTIMSSDEIQVSEEISIPKSLKSIVADAPESDEAIEVYLSELVKANKITTDDATFLIDSGVFE